MPFKPGHPKPVNAGRKKGTPNKTNQNLVDLAQKLKVDPFEILLHFAAGNWRKLGYSSETLITTNADGNTTVRPYITPEMRVNAASRACEYLYPKRKALELDTGKGIIPYVIETLDGGKIEMGMRESSNDESPT